MRLVIKNVLVGLIGILASSVSAQIVRQESTNELKKAVYTVNLAGCPQRVIRKTGDGDEWYENHYAVVAIPELTLTNNTPLLDMLFPSYASADFSGWVHSDQADVTCFIDNQVVYIKWKFVGAYGESIDATNVMIVVVYESQPQPEQSLKVLNTGTGKSLALEWSTNAPNAKVDGYKVYRRNFTE